MSVRWIAISLTCLLILGCGPSAETLWTLNNGRQIAIATMSFEASYEKSAINVVDDEGQPLLSWRIRLLPFMEYGLVSDQINVEEPWDSEQNRKLHDLMPECYQAYSSTSTSETTWKLLPANSSGIMFIAGGKGSETNWMKPDQFQLDPNDPLSGLGETPRGGFAIVRKDGATLMLSASELSAELKQAKIDPTGDWYPD